MGPSTKTYIETKVIVLLEDLLSVDLFIIKALMIKALLVEHL